MDFITADLNEVDQKLSLALTNVNSHLPDETYSFRLDACTCNDDESELGAVKSIEFSTSLYMKQCKDSNVTAVPEIL